jgi:hypothetical protein
MVFYNLLPTELWFIIYKMEHSSFLSSVNAEIKNLAIEVNRVNTQMFINMPTHPLLQESMARHSDGINVEWDINEWLSFKKGVARHGGCAADNDQGFLLATIVGPLGWVELWEPLGIHRYQGTWSS